MGLKTGEDAQILAQHGHFDTIGNNIIYLHYARQFPGPPYLQFALTVSSEC